MELQNQGAEVAGYSSQVRLSRAVEACWYTQGLKVGVCIFAAMPLLHMESYRLTFQLNTTSL